MDTQQILYGEYCTKTTKNRKRKENWIFLKPYTPYHSRARRLYNILKSEFGFDVIYKKTKSSWEHYTKEKEAN